jgi:hypothetical protein
MRLRLLYYAKKEVSGGWKMLGICVSRILNGAEKILW